MTMLEHYNWTVERPSEEGYYFMRWRPEGEIQEKIELRKVVRDEKGELTLWSKLYPTPVYALGDYWEWDGPVQLDEETLKHKIGWNLFDSLR